MKLKYGLTAALMVGTLFSAEAFAGHFMVVHPAAFVPTAEALLFTPVTDEQCHDFSDSPSHEFDDSPTAEEYMLDQLFN